MTACLAKPAVLCAAIAAIFGASPSFADSATPYALQQALQSNQHFDLYNSKNLGGLQFGSSYFSGPANGVNSTSNVNNFGNDQQMYALLVDGRYDFNHEATALSSPLHPYLMGSMGVAHTSSGYTSNLDSAGNSTVPLFRVGGGVAYRLDQQWDMSLDYKAGVAASAGGDYLFTGRGQQQVDMQSLNVGMHYAF